MLYLSDPKRGLAANATIVVIYHRADMDGRMGAGVAYRKLGSNAFYYGMNYEDVTYEEIVESFPNAERIYLIDYSLKAEIIQKLLARKVFITLIDHHETALNEIMAEFEKWSPHEVVYFSYQINKGLSGVALAWIRFFPEEPMPKAVSLISTYDLWKKDSPNWLDALHLNSGLYFGKNTQPHSTLWSHLLDQAPELCTTECDAIIEQGAFVEEVNKHRSTIDAKSWGGTLNWEGITFFALNTSGNSRVAEPGVISGLHQAILLYRWNPKICEWKVSLYHSDVVPNGPRLNDIAAKYGGGGHEGACGFSCKDLPFKLTDIEMVEV